MPDGLPLLTITRRIERRDPEAGGFAMLRLSATEIAALPGRRKARLIAVLDGEHPLRCGINPLTGSEGFIMLSKTVLTRLGLQPGKMVEAELYADPDPLGAEMPGDLETLLQENPDLDKRFAQLSDGSKRTLIHGMNRLKSPERRLEMAAAWLKGR